MLLTDNYYSAIERYTCILLSNITCQQITRYIVSMIYCLNVDVVILLLCVFYGYYI